MSLPARSPSTAPAHDAAASPRLAGSIGADALALELEAVLAELDAQVQRLALLSGERREAMRRADTSGLARTIASENDAVQTVADLEKRRLGVVSKLAERLAMPDKSQARASDVAAKLGGPIGERIAHRAVVLKQRLDALAKANASLQMAAAHLASHMEGLIRQTAVVLNHAKTYARSGHVTPGAMIVSALDIRS